MDYTKTFPSNYPYFVSTAPTSPPAVKLADVKAHLKLDPSDESEDPELTLLINAASSFCEKYTRRTLLQTGFKTFRDVFTPTIELRRSPFQSLTSFKYLVSGSLTDVDSDLYYIQLLPKFSKILLAANEYYPTDKDDQLQSIEIIFVAGYATDADNLKALQPELYLAILNHIAKLYENRGDCDLAAVTKALPNTSKLLYDSLRIIESV